MSEFTTDTFPNDDSFHPGENLLYSNEQLAPACELLAEVSDRPVDEFWQLIGDFRTQTHRGDGTMSDAQWNAANRELATRTPKGDFTPYEVPEKLARTWASVLSGATYTERIIRIDELAGDDHKHITHSLLFDEKSTSYVGEQLTRATQDLPAFREHIAELGGATAVVERLQKLQLELQTQLDWAFVVQGINLHGGFGLSIASFSSMRKRYVELAEDALRTLRLESAQERLTKIVAMKQSIAASFAGADESWNRKDPLYYYLVACERNANHEPSMYDLHARILNNLCEYVPRRISEEAEQAREQQRTARAAEIQAAYKDHTEQSVPTLSGKARKRAGYDGLWNALIGRTEDKDVQPMLDNEALRVLSTLHALRTMVEPSFDGVHDAHTWQQEVRDYEQTLTEEYAALGYQKGLPYKESVGARLDWLSSNWDFVASQARAIPEFPVQRVAAALFPEVASTIQQQEQTAETERTAAVAQRLGAVALEQLRVREVDWEILPVEHIGERIRQEVAQMTKGKRQDGGRRELQEVRVRDLIELSTLFDDVVVHVSREKDGITRRKNEPYFVIDFTYGGQKFALAENLVLDNATFILPESDFSWQDVFSLPRGAVGEFGAQRINHPAVDESGEYEGGPSAHVNAIFAKLDKALQQA